MIYNVCVYVYICIYIEVHIYVLVLISSIILGAFVGFFGCPWVWPPTVLSRQKERRIWGFPWDSQAIWAGRGKIAR